MKSVHCNKRDHEAGEHEAEAEAVEAIAIEAKAKAEAETSFFGPRGRSRSEDLTSLGRDNKNSFSILFAKF